MSIDVDSIYESHKGVDYYGDIIWNFSQKQWNNIIGEYYRLGDRTTFQNISMPSKEEGIDFSALLHNSLFLTHLANLF